jgi:hypothetical protein
MILSTVSTPVCSLHHPLCNPLSHRVDSVAHIPVPTSRAVPFPAQSDDSATAIIGPPSPSHPTQRQLPKSVILLRPLQPFQSPPQINSGGSRLTFASPPRAGSHHDSHDQSQTIPMELFCHQTQSSLPFPSPPDIVLDSLECEGRQHGLN